MPIVDRNLGYLPVAKRAALFAALSAASFTLSACGKKPGGQVVAVVNSQEITQQELRSEAEASNVPPEGFQSATPMLIDRIVQRNLYADYARKEGLDRSPEYVTRRRLLEQTLLSSLALRKIVGPPVKPSAEDVQKFTAANPTLFAQRARLALDQVRFPTPANLTQIKALTSLGSLSAIEAKIRSTGGQVARGATTLDTATVDPIVARQISNLKDGEIFDLSIGGTTFVSAITGRTPAATDPAQWPTAAASLMERQRAEHTVSQFTEKLRKEAKIQYDPAFKPSKAPK